jgi:hypothetical protein
MRWSVFLHRDFDPEFELLPQPVRDALLQALELLAALGPMLGRPQVDTLSGSRFANMKELRFQAHGGVWRVAFAFDPKRQAILLVAGDKSGISQSRFYKGLIAKADNRFAQHLNELGED